MNNQAPFTVQMKERGMHNTGRPFFLLLCSCLLWCVCLNPSFCRGEEAPAGKEELALSLKQCVELLITNNLDLKVEQFNPYLQEKEITKEKAAFDPLLQFSLQDNKLVISPTTLLNGVLQQQSYEQEILDYEWRLAKKLVTGGFGEVKFTTNKYETNSIFQYDSPTYFSNLIFSLNQPLLRNFGINLNKSRIIISRNNKEISHTKLRHKTAKMITGLQRIYWSVHLSQQILTVKEQSLALAQNLMERNEALVEVGKLPSFEVLRAKTGVAFREEDVILAENATKDAEDLLKETLNLPFQEQMVVLLDKPIYNAFPSMEVESYLTRAREKRPEYEEAKIHLENLKIATKVAKNAMLPLLDFQASYGMNATKGHYDKSVKGIEAGGDYSWMVGFKLEIPLGNRWAKGNYQKSTLEIEKAETSLKSLERKIELEIREALRDVESSHKRINATQEAERLAEKNLEAEEERMKVGMSTSVDVLRAQDELAFAQSRKTKALVDYINSLNHLDQVAGTTLDTYRIELYEES